ncbi:hypothetical protein DENSPDRAFT_519428 [Dentipellis sp. KUC8613]|nr:hypothetical protein DENSPDRAFT_519428 [Dentipellis sp. KUC8613]
MDLGSNEMFASALEQMRIATYLDLGASTLLIYDYFITFPDEKNIIWGSRWTIAKAVFVLNRYSAFVTVGLCLYDLRSEISAATCHNIYNVHAWTLVLGFTVSEAILVIRTYVIWQENKLVGWGLVVVLVAATVVNGVNTQKFVETLQFIPTTGMAPYAVGCFPTYSHEVCIYCAIVVAYELVILCLTLIKGIQYFKAVGASSRLITSLYRDGVLAFLFVFPWSFICLIVQSLGVLKYGDLLPMSTRTIHVVLTSRIFLNIRQNAQARTVVASNADDIELEQMVSAFEAAPGRCHRC